MNSVHLCHKLQQELREIGLPGSKSQQLNLTLLCQSMAVSANCRLATLALGLPIPGQRENLIQRVRRLLKNEHIRPSTFYKPMVKHVMSKWTGHEVSLVMDRTDILNRWSILTVGAAYQKRLLPLAWDVLKFGGTSAERQIAMLERVRPYLPSQEQVRVHFYGDSEFRAVPLQKYVGGNGWHWQVGLKRDVQYHRGDGCWQALNQIPLKQGERSYIQGVTLTQKHEFGPVNLIAEWPKNQEHPRYWSLDLPADKQAWRRGRKRYWTEPLYRDWKSYGFDLEATKIDDPDRLDTLLLAMSITTLWCIHIGDWLTRHGRRHWLEAPHKNDYSLFRLGRDHIQRARTIDAHIPIGFTVNYAT